MKYFTLEWWNAVQTGDLGDPSDTYGEYYKSVKDKLPGDLIKLHEEIFLHDGKLKSLDISFPENRMSIELDTDDGKGNLREISLRYTGLTKFKSTADPDNGLPGPRGYGDLGYDEVELLSDGRLEHRMLFSSGIVLSIQFKSIELKYKDHK